MMAVQDVEYWQEIPWNVQHDGDYLHREVISKMWHQNCEDDIDNDTRDKGNEPHKELENSRVLVFLYTS